jgi:hypothetical protein
MNQDTTTSPETNGNFRGFRTIHLPWEIPNRPQKTSNIANRRREILEKYHDKTVIINDIHHPDIYLMGQLTVQEDSPDHYELNVGNKQLRLTYRNISSIAIQQEMPLSVLERF